MSAIYIPNEEEARRLMEAAGMNTKGMEVWAAEYDNFTVSLFAKRTDPACQWRIKYQFEHGPRLTVGAIICTAGDQGYPWMIDIQKFHEVAMDIYHNRI